MVSKAIESKAHIVILSSCNWRCCTANYVRFMTQILQKLSVNALLSTNLHPVNVSDGN